MSSLNKVGGNLWSLPKTSPSENTGIMTGIEKKVRPKNTVFPKSVSTESRGNKTIGASKDFKDNAKKIEGSDSMTKFLGVMREKRQRQYINEKLSV